MPNPTFNPSSTTRSPAAKKPACKSRRITQANSSWIECASPLWGPGIQTGYHALTIGWILGEVAQRVDGRPIARIVAEDICRPLNINSLFFGMPDAVADRLAVLEHQPNPNLVGGGVDGVDGVDGVRLLSPERVRIASRMQTDAMDVVIEQAWPKAMGYFLGSASATTTCVSPTAFGHTGAGGFTAYADPAHELAFALCKTRMVDASDPDTMTARLFERELHHALGIEHC